MDETLIKNFVGTELPFPSFSCLPLSSFSFFLYFLIFSWPRLRNMGKHFSHLVGPGGAWPPNEI